MDNFVLLRCIWQTRQAFRNQTNIREKNFIKYKNYYRHTTYETHCRAENLFVFRNKAHAAANLDSDTLLKIRRSSTLEKGGGEVTRKVLLYDTSNALLSSSPKRTIVFGPDVTRPIVFAEHIEGFGRTELHKPQRRKIKSFKRPAHSHSRLLLALNPAVTIALAHPLNPIPVNQNVTTYPWGIAASRAELNR